MEEQKPAKKAGKYFKEGNGSDDELISVGSSSV